MAGLVERQLLRAVDAVRGGDPARVARVLGDESEVNRIHMQTRPALQPHDRAASADRRGPARDHRRPAHNNDLERIGDEAKKIAIRARNLQARTLPQGQLDRLHEMAIDVAEMLRESVRAFARRDSALAAEVAARDESVDSARDRLIAALVDEISRNEGLATVGVDLAFVAQSIERVGDHAKNIAEYVIRIVDGVDPRHRAVA